MVEPADKLPRKATILPCATHFNFSEMFTLVSHTCFDNSTDTDFKVTPPPPPNAWESENLGCSHQFNALRITNVIEADQYSIKYCIAGRATEGRLGFLLLRARALLPPLALYEGAVMSFSVPIEILHMHENGRGLMAARPPSHAPPRRGRAGRRAWS